MPSDTGLIRIGWDDLTKPVSDTSKDEEGALLILSAMSLLRRTVTLCWSRKDVFPRRRRTDLCFLSRKFKHTQGCWLFMLFLTAARRQ